MNILKEIKELRQLHKRYVSFHGLFTGVLHILAELENQQIYQGSLIKDLQKVFVANRDLGFETQEELKPCPFCGSGVWQDGHKIVHCPVCKINFNMTPRDWNRRSNA